MDRSTELDQILSAALSIEKVPPPDSKVLQETLIELYTILGIPQEEFSEVLNSEFHKVRSPNAPVGSYSYENLKGVKRSLNEVAMMACKRPRTSTEGLKSNTAANSSIKATENVRQVHGLHTQTRVNSRADSVPKSHVTQRLNAPQIPLQFWLQNGGYASQFQGVQAIQVPAAGGTSKMVYVIPKYPNLPVGTQIPLNSLLQPK
ncbi:homeobox protein siamois-like [Spea bombifrons]|uniref:homeobox protein siamois-like n=1 Tax=Spea bombifrons TaxID=233779 RepID=UPI00234B400C|nr:homeobox protein siamois-like [Spea bombifrons]